MKDLDIAYMAGILDGEGCISITKICPKNTNLHNLSYGLQVRVGMVDKSIPLLFYYAFGGSFLQKIYSHKGYRNQWLWRVSGVLAVRSLKILLPYLRSKKNEAELAIRFWEVKRHRTVAGEKGRQGNIPKSADEIALENNYYTLMRQFKDKSEVMVNG